MSKGPSLRMEIDALKAQGNFFTKDVSKTIAENTKDAVEWVAKQGPRLVARELADLRNPTGFTAGNVEGFAYKRTRIVTGAPVASLYGKVRLKPGLNRGGSPGWPSDRVPYVINSVLETGRWRGEKGGRVEHRQFRRAAVRLRGYVRAIRIDLTKGLE